MRYAGPKFLALLLVTWVAGSSRVAAEQWAQTPEGKWHVVAARQELPSVFSADSALRPVGVTLLTGFPDGIAPGVSVHPGTNLVHLDLGITGALSFGVRGGATFDPFDWVLAPTLTVAGGYSAWAKVPSTPTQYQLTYVNVQPGIELGRRSRFRVFLRAGYSHFWVAGQTSQTISGLQATSQPRANINFFPSVSFGVTVFPGE